MASLLLTRRISTLTIGLTASSLLITPLILNRPRQLHLCDSGPGFSDSRTYVKDKWAHPRSTLGTAGQGQTPVVKEGVVNPQAIKQISAGSITGLLTGLTLSLFSKPLTLLFGLLVFGVQLLESRGIHIVPYGRIQNYFTSINIRNAMQDNVAFKLSFGVTCALAGFAEF